VVAAACRRRRRSVPTPEKDRSTSAQLATISDVERSGWMVQQSEPHPVTGVKLELPMIVVVLKLVMVLCLLEPLVQLEDELIMLC
jgi:hypothetical protein